MREFLRALLVALANDRGAVRAERIARERDERQARIDAAEAKVMAVYELLPIGVCGTHDELFAALAEIRAALTGETTPE